jgi:hypothetical protein
MTMMLKWELGLIPHGSMSRALLVGSLAVASVGCHFGAISTAGTTYMSQDYDNPYLQAVRGSGLQDLKCPLSTITTDCGALTKSCGHDRSPSSPRAPVVTTATANSLSGVSPG